MRAFLGLLLAGLLAACGTTEPMPAPAPAAAPPDRTVRLLEQVGVTDVVPRDPPSAEPAESLTGTWRGHQVVVDVTPTGQALFREPVLRSYRVRDRAARVVDSPPYTFHRVNLGRFLWDVSVPDDEALTQALVKALVDSRLPPEETPAELVAQANHLYGAHVARSGDDLTVTSLWGIYCEHGGGCDPAVLVHQAADGERTYEVGTYDELRSALPAGDRTTHPQLPTPPGVTGRPTALRSSSAPDPVLWLETDTGQVLVSTDDAVTFRELELR